MQKQLKRGAGRVDERSESTEGVGGFAALIHGRSPCFGIVANLCQPVEAYASSAHLGRATPLRQSVGSQASVGESGICYCVMATTGVFS